MDPLQVHTTPFVQQGPVAHNTSSWILGCCTHRVHVCASVHITLLNCEFYECTTYWIGNRVLTTSALEDSVNHWKWQQYRLCPLPIDSTRQAALNRQLPLYFTCILSQWWRPRWCARIQMTGTVSANCACSRTDWWRTKADGRSSRFFCWWSSSWSASFVWYGSVLQTFARCKTGHCPFI